MGGVQSGEGIVNEVRDAKWGVEKKRGRSRSVIDQEAEVLLDRGSPDKRLLVVAEEFSHLLKMAARQGNTTTEILRELWDSPVVQRNTNKNSPLCATEPHVSLIGHCTKPELVGVLTKIDLTNGFANRILWLAAYRAKILPDPEEINWNAHAELLKTLGDIYQTFFDQNSQTQNPRQFKHSQAARDLWRSMYVELENKKHRGFTDGALARDASHVQKIAMLFCLLDHSTLIDPKHLKAALAFYEYVEASTAWIFNDSTGNTLSNRILYTLHTNPKAREEGLSLSDIHRDITSRNTPAVVVHQALDILVQADLIRPLLRESRGPKGTTTSEQRWIINPERA
jgi:hypothetical protein